MLREERILYSPTIKIRGWLQLAREKGVDVDHFLTSRGMTETELLNPNTRIPREQAIAFFHKLFEPIGDPEIGLRAAERFDLSDADLFGYIIQNCPNLKAAMDTFSAYSRLISDADFKIEIVGARVVGTIGLTGARKMDPVTDVDYIMGTLCLMVRKLTRGTVSPIEVQMTRPRPLHPKHYRDFFRAPVTFGTEQCALHYPVSALQVSLGGSDLRLREILEERANTVLADLPKKSTFIDQIRSYISSRIEYGQTLAIESAAQKFGMSERTFKRRLREAGRCYSELVEDVRREEAIALARDSTYNVTTIAHRVGFSNTTSFARAFRRWTGFSPTEYLKKYRGSNSYLLHMKETK